MISYNNERRPSLKDIKETQPNKIEESCKVDTFIEQNTPQEQFNPNFEWKAGKLTCTIDLVRKANDAPDHVYHNQIVVDSNKNIKVTELDYGILNFSNSGVKLTSSWIGPDNLLNFELAQPKVHILKTPYTETTTNIQENWQLQPGICASIRRFIFPKYLFKIIPDPFYPDTHLSDILTHDTVEKTKVIEYKDAFASCSYVLKSFFSKPAINSADETALTFNINVKDKNIIDLYYQINGGNPNYRAEATILLEFDYKGLGSEPTNYISTSNGIDILVN